MNNQEFKNCPPVQRVLESKKYFPPVSKIKYIPPWPHPDAAAAAAAGPAAVTSAAASAVCI